MNDENTGAPEVRPSTSLLDCGLVQRNRQAMFATEATLRDQFAIAALAGILADSSLHAEIKEMSGVIARSSYQLADAMMEARNAH